MGEEVASLHFSNSPQPEIISIIRWGTYNWWASIGSSSCSTHLWWNESWIHARTGQGPVDFMMTHHGKWSGIRAGDGQRCPQGRGSWKREENLLKWCTLIRVSFALINTEKRLLKYSRCTLCALVNSFISYFSRSTTFHIIQSILQIVCLLSCNSVKWLSEKWLIKPRVVNYYLMPPSQVVCPLVKGGVLE